jgi:HSP90 family molecular chaperone
MEEKKLRMSFDPHTIEHLGVKMYSILPNAIAELIANAYDAEAEVVEIELKDDEREKSISVIDDGVGMTFEEVNDKFLRIGQVLPALQIKKNKTYSHNERKVNYLYGILYMNFGIHVNITN